MNRRPYFADFDPASGEAAVFKRLRSGRAEIVWRLVGHTTLEAARGLAEQMNNALHTED